MAFFSLIDNFFLISVLIIFVLMGFLIYHFKTRISVAEQKTDTLFRLMTVITRKVSSLFDSENAPSENPGPSPSQDLGPSSYPPTPLRPEDKLKSDPEVHEPIVLTLSATEPASIPIHRIVVSDDSDSEYSTDSDSESESDSESDIESVELEELEIHDEPPKDSLLVSETVLELIQFAEPTVEITSFEPSDEKPEETENAEEPENTEEPEAPKEKTEYSIDQLRKMNINQLKTIAIQNGICSDTTKIKKGELIQLIQKGN